MYIGVRGLYNCINVPMVNEKDVLFTRDIKKPKTGLQNTWWMDLELGTRSINMTRKPVPTEISSKILINSKRVSKNQKKF